MSVIKSKRTLSPIEYTYHFTRTYEYMRVCDSLGLKFNLKKTHITKVSKGFTFLKVRYRVTATGKIIKTLTRKGIVRMRRKLKKFRKKVDEGIMTLDNVYDSM